MPIWSRFRSLAITTAMLVTASAAFAEGLFPEHMFDELNKYEATVKLMGIDGKCSGKSGSLGLTKDCKPVVSQPTVGDLVSIPIRLKCKTENSGIFELITFARFGSSIFRERVNFLEGLPTRYSNEIYSKDGEWHLVQAIDNKVPGNPRIEFRDIDSKSDDLKTFKTLKLPQVFDLEMFVCHDAGARLNYDSLLNSNMTNNHVEGIDDTERGQGAAAATQLPASNEADTSQTSDASSPVACSDGSQATIEGEVGDIWRNKANGWSMGVANAEPSCLTIRNFIASKRPFPSTCTTGAHVIVHVTVVNNIIGAVSAGIVDINCE